MNVVQGYGSESDEEPFSEQPEASGSRKKLNVEAEASEDEDEEGGAVDASDVFGLNGLAKSTVRSEVESSALVRAAPEVLADVSGLLSSVCSFC